MESDRRPWPNFALLQTHHWQQLLWRYPAAWDPRVVDLVSFVEKQRGLNFEHPVFVDFLDPQAVPDRQHRRLLVRKDALPQ